MKRRHFIKSLGAGLLVPIAPAIITSRGVIATAYSAPVGSTFITPSAVASDALDALRYNLLGVWLADDGDWHSAPLFGNLRHYRVQKAGGH